MSDCVNENVYFPQQKSDVPAIVRQCGTVTCVE